MHFYSVLQQAFDGPSCINYLLATDNACSLYMYTIHEALLFHGMKSPRASVLL